MDGRLVGLNMLSNFKNSDWKIGKSDFYINSISSKVSTLPEHVFNHFYISDTSSKQISVVDFALMTYDMGITERNRLMELYGIEADTISEILQTADDISTFLDSLAEQSIEETTSYHSEESQKVFKAPNNDEIDV